MAQSSQRWNICHLINPSRASQVSMRQTYWAVSERYLLDKRNCRLDPRNSQIEFQLRNLSLTQRHLHRYWFCPIFRECCNTNRPNIANTRHNILLYNTHCFLISCSRDGNLCDCGSDEKNQTLQTREKTGWIRDIRGHLPCPEMR